MRAYVWGSGYLSKDTIIKTKPKVEIIGIIDSFDPNDSTEIEGKVYPVIRPEMAVGTEYDAVIVANGHSDEIYHQAKSLGLDMNRFIFLWNNFYLCEYTKNTQLVEEILGPHFSTSFFGKNRLISSMRIDHTKPSPVGEDMDRTRDGYSYDYVRLRTLEACAEEIHRAGVEGDVAELGVFRGEFSRYINAFFPERRLYLFDTFESFDADEAQREKDAGNIDQRFVEFFKDTSVERVLSVLSDPGAAVIKKGFFPSSLEGLDSNFAFVSIDVDLEQSIYDGIDYFYPRLSEGGYIFIHDVNSTLPGVRKAIDRYESDRNTILKKVPLCDIDGTMVLTK